MLASQGVGPDCRISNAAHPDALDFIHRRDAEREIYFVANRTNLAQSADVEFRVSGRVPELWDAVTGLRRRPDKMKMREGCTGIRIDFAPCGSWFVVFPRKSSLAEAVEHDMRRGSGDSIQLNGPWTVRFRPEWGGPESATFESLTSWTTRPEEGIRCYSGVATYTKEVAWPTPLAPGAELWLDLGDVRELAEVRVNGQSCGVVWTPPFRVNISRAVKPGTNQCEIDVVNFWPNRIIGDASLPAELRRTRTNVRKLVAGTPLMESGLLGPVSIQAGLR